MDLLANDSRTDWLVLTDEGFHPDSVYFYDDQLYLVVQHSSDLTGSFEKYCYNFFFFFFYWYLYYLYTSQVSEQQISANGEFFLPNSAGGLISANNAGQETNFGLNIFLKMA